MRFTFVWPQHDFRGGRALFLLGCVIFAEPLTSTLLFPFVFLMVSEFTQDPTLIGLRVGLITSSFFVCQLFTTPLWGSLADRIGRKPILALGLLGGALSMTCFGLSQSLVWAMLSRCIGGLLNANMGVARTCLGEVATRYNLKQSQAFAVFGVCAALGYAVGPLVGGFLAEPARKFGFKGPEGIFAHYPFLLPCLVSAGINVAIFIAATCGLEESSHWCKVDPNGTSEDPEDIGEQDPLLPEIPAQDTVPGTSMERWKLPSLPKGVPILMLATGLVSMHGIMFDEVFPLFAASSLRHGWGLSFDSTQIAKLLVFVGPAIFISQAFLYPRLNARLSTIQLWRWSGLVFTLVYPLVPLTPLIPNDILRQITLIAILCVRVSSSVIGWTSLNILTNQIASAAHRGFITSIVQASASFSRAVGPIVGGAIWSWGVSHREQRTFDHYIFFLATTLVAVLQLATANWISREAATAG